MNSMSFFTKGFSTTGPPPIPVTHSSTSGNLTRLQYVCVMDPFAGPSLKKRRKGGIHQRLQEDEEEKKTPSDLLALLMRMYAKGSLSGDQVHILAKAGQSDIEKASEGFEVQGLKQVASLAQSRNLARQLNSTLSKQCTLPMPMEVKIPFKGAPDGADTASILLPHEMFSAFFNSEELWRTKILPEAERLPAFWSGFQGHPCMAGHPVLSIPGFEKHTIPLGFHGDEVPIVGVGKIWCRSVLFLSWFSLMGVAAGSTAEQAMVYINGLFEKFILPSDDSHPGSMAILWRILAWSFTAIYDGCWPARDWRGHRWAKGSAEARRAGQRLAGPWRGCLVQMAGDLDYYSKYFDTPRWSNHSKPCALCKCTHKGPMSWLDNRVNSIWQSSMVTPSTWRTHFDSTNSMLEIPGMNALSIAMDWMHCMHLGWLQYMFGSVMHLLVFLVLPEEPLVNLATVADFIKTHQKNNRCKHPYRMQLTKLTMFQPKKGYPKLRGRAADIAGLHEAMLSVWQQFRDASDVRHQQVELLLSLNHQIHDLLDEFSPRHGYLRIPAAQADQLFLKGLQMSQLQGQLLETFEGEDVKVFNITSKTHFALHCLQLSKHVHPFLTWCYKGESTMRRIQCLWKSCLAGSKHFQVANRAALKERHLLNMRG